MKWPDFFLDVGAGIVSTILIIFLVWFRNFFLNIFLRVYHYLYTMIFRKHYVLIWNDDDIAYSIKLGRLLKEDYNSVVFKPLRNPKDIRNFPLYPSIVKAIILIDTDGTKLSGDKIIRNDIQKYLIKYLSKGGGIVGTHDIIYRRVRNRDLEKAFGCQITDYCRTEGVVKYKRNASIKWHPVFKGLPDNFILNDGEVCWGSWSPDVQILYYSEGDEKPLVTAREYSIGKLVWLNSGDKKERLPKSISLPETEFIILLKNSMDWVGNLS